MSPVAVTQLTGVPLMMESMLPVSSARGTCAMWLMQLLSVASCVTQQWEWGLIRCRSRVARSQHSTSLAWRLWSTLLTIKLVALVSVGST